LASLAEMLFMNRSCVRHFLPLLLLRV